MPYITTTPTATTTTTTTTFFFLSMVVCSFPWYGSPNRGTRPLAFAPFGIALEACIAHRHPRRLVSRGASISRGAGGRGGAQNKAVVDTRSTPLPRGVILGKTSHAQAGSLSSGRSDIIMPTPSSIQCPHLHADTN